MIKTRLNEKRYITSDAKEMLNKYTAKRVLRTWKEEFVDESTGEITPIERSELILENGILIDQDALVKIRFYMETGDIKEVEVSNQKRLGHESANNYLHPYLAQVRIGDKNSKFLFYADSLDMALLLLRDYIELNFRDLFWITVLKEFESCIILNDTIKKHRPELPFDQWDLITEDQEEEEKESKKFYQIECKVEYDGNLEGNYVFVVNTFNIDRAMWLINKYIIEQEEQRQEEAEKLETGYVKRDYQTMIESAKPIPVGYFIPKEFSIAYLNNQ